METTRQELGTKTTLQCIKRGPLHSEGSGERYVLTRPPDSHAGALLAAAVSGAHVWAAVSDVEVVQGPGLLLVKRSLLEPAEPRGRRPTITDRALLQYNTMEDSHQECWEVGLTG